MIEGLQLSLNELSIPIQPSHSTTNDILAEQYAVQAGMDGGEVAVEGIVVKGLKDSSALEVGGGPQEVGVPEASVSLMKGNWALTPVTKEVGVSDAGLITQTLVTKEMGV